MSALDTQVGGNHYKDFAIQPVEYITKNSIPFLEGNIIKYVSRWTRKGGKEDLEKAQHYLDLLIEFNSGVEQQAVHLSCKQGDEGSNPSPGTISHRHRGTRYYVNKEGNWVLEDGH